MLVQSRGSRSTRSPFSKKGRCKMMMKMKYTSLLLLILTAILPNEGLGQGTSTVPLPVTGVTSILSYSAAQDIANAGAGDIYCIFGSSTTKLVRVKEVRITASASSAVLADVNLYKRSSLPSGGVAVPVTIVPHDSQNPAATATITSYTSSPTPGTAVGVVRHQRIAIGSQGNTANDGLALFEFVSFWGQPIVLRNAN